MAHCDRGREHKTAEGVRETFLSLFPLPPLKGTFSEPRKKRALIKGLPKFLSSYPYSFWCASADRMFKIISSFFRTRILSPALSLKKERRQKLGPWEREKGGLITAQKRELVTTSLGNIKEGPPGRQQGQVKGA